MGYLIFRGVSTASLTNVYVAQMPSHKKAPVRDVMYYVNGRDGALHINNGFGNFDIEVTLVLFDASASQRQIVNAWADGTGKLISSDDLTKAYKATVKDEVEWTRAKGNTGYYDTALITFDCQPFMYESVDSVNEYTQTSQMLNPGSAEAFPLIKVEGSGNVSFTFCGEEIGIDNMSASVPVFIDCENGYIYTANGSATTMHGNIPVIPLGASEVTFGTGVSKITVTPHWRWV